MSEAVTTSTEATCLVEAASGLDDTWSPRVAGRVNDVLVKVARIEGEFVWHDHPATDEAFLALMEAAGTVNTGAAGGSLTAPVDQPL